MSATPNVNEPPVRVECATSAGFCDWIAQAGGSLILSTYQAGKVATIDVEVGADVMPGQPILTIAT